MVNSRVGFWPCSQTLYEEGGKRLAKDKQSSLLRKFVNYGQNKFYNIGPWKLSQILARMLQFQEEEMEEDPERLGLHVDDRLNVPQEDGKILVCFIILKKNILWLIGPDYPGAINFSQTK